MVMYTFSVSQEAQRTDRLERRADQRTADVPQSHEGSPHHHDVTAAQPGLLSAWSQHEPCISSQHPTSNWFLRT